MLRRITLVCLIALLSVYGVVFFHPCSTNDGVCKAYSSFVSFADIPPATESKLVLAVIFALAGAILISNRRV